jgi:hypothetical protein
MCLDIFKIGYVLTELFIKQKAETELKYFLYIFKISI